MNETINVFDRLKTQVDVELFYDISIRDGEIVLQGRYSLDAVKSINAGFKAGNINWWEVNEIGHCNLVSSLENCQIKFCLA